MAGESSTGGLEMPPTHEMLVADFALTVGFEDQARTLESAAKKSREGILTRIEQEATLLDDDGLVVVKKAGDLPSELIEGLWLRSLSAHVRAASARAARKFANQMRDEVLEKYQGKKVIVSAVNEGDQPIRYTATGASRRDFVRVEGKITNIFPGENVLRIRPKSLLKRMDGFYDASLLDTDPNSVGARCYVSFLN